MVHYWIKYIFCTMKYKFSEDIKHKYMILQSYLICVFLISSYISAGICSIK